ncbi:MAG: hypothetical protein NTW21_36850 [Verrucomicrobia bacterium]|nr:hypothetical protein [Verrucomicrobiota bacterium]
MNHNLIPATPMNASRLSSLAGNSLKVLAVVFILGLVLYLLLVVWLHHDLARHAVSISQAVGAPAEAERILNGFLSWLLACALIPAIVRLVAESLNPFRSGSTVVGKIALLMAIAIASALLPHTLRVVRGVDAQGLPCVMQPSDPVAAQWFNPDGKATLFWSKEDDGTLRFWSRPGMTPDTGVPSTAVTPAMRKDWEAQKKAKDEAQREQSRLEQEQQRAEQNERERVAGIERTQRQQREDQARRDQQEAGANRLRMDKDRVEAELLAARAAVRQAQTTERTTTAKAEKAQALKVQPQRSARQATVTSTPKSQRQAAPWQVYQIIPGKYLELRLAADEVELKTDRYLELERPGGLWLSVQGGVTPVNNRFHSMRLHCRTPFPHNIYIRTANH